MDFQPRRQRIVQYLLSVIKAAEDSDKSISEDHLIASCCLQFYCGERLVQELLKQLKLTNRVGFEFGELFIVKPGNQEVE